MKPFSFLIVCLFVIGAQAVSITKEEVCSMLDSLSSGQLQPKRLSGDEFTLNYKNSELFRYDNYKQFKEWFIECYDKDKLQARIIAEGKIIEAFKSTVGNYKWITFSYEGYTLEALCKKDGCVAVGEVKYKKDDTNIIRAK